MISNQTISTAFKFSALWGGRASVRQEAVQTFLQPTQSAETAGRRTARTLFFMFAVLLLSLPAFAAGKKAPDFDGLPNNNKVDVIIQFNLPPTAADIASIKAMRGGIQQAITFSNTLR